MTQESKRAARGLVFVLAGAHFVHDVFTSFVAELVVFPAIYFIWRARRLERGPLFRAEDRIRGSV